MPTLSIERMSGCLIVLVSSPLPPISISSTMSGFLFSSHEGSLSLTVHCLLMNAHQDTVCTLDEVGTTLQSILKLLTSSSQLPWGLATPLWPLESGDANWRKFLILCALIWAMMTNLPCLCTFVTQWKCQCMPVWQSCFGDVLLEQLLPESYWTK